MLFAYTFDCIIVKWRQICWSQPIFGDARDLIQFSSGHSSGRLSKILHTIISRNSHKTATQAGSYLTKMVLLHLSDNQSESQNVAPRLTSEVISDAVVA